MGSWSVCCGISNIAITAGQRCVLLPIKENKRSEMGGYIPACLPIFGEYDDYGGITNIEKDDNTDFLEKNLGIEIEDLAVFLVDGKFTYNRDEAREVAEKLTETEVIKEVQNWRFMWIDRDVYNFMIQNHDEHEKGYMDYGTTEMLTLLGFNFVEESKTFPNYDPKRFCKKWQKGDVFVYSDGRTMLSAKGKGTYIYHYGKGDQSSIETYFEVPQELHYLQSCSKVEAWRLMNKKQRKEEMGYILGIDRFGFDMEEIYAEMFSNMSEEQIAEIGVRKKVEKPKTIEKRYFDEIDTFGDRIVHLINIRHNLYPMSGQFSPHVLYLTPQCGEYEQHQKLLDKFSEINRQHLRPEEEDDI